MNTRSGATLASASLVGARLKAAVESELALPVVSVIGSLPASQG